jgi:hypothetical protein
VSNLGYIDSNGHYIRGKDKSMGFDVNTQFKDWSHDNQRKRLNADIVQPYLSDGSANPEFVGVYRGEVADRYYNRDQQDKADRKLS